MGYKVIARKYRPRNFGEVVGQQHVTQTLANAIQSNRVAHAYIFSGVRGVGKTTTARILAKALNCAKGPTAEPDDTCESCRSIAAGTSLDVLEIDAASNRGIDQIRELREMVRYAPAVSRYKVVILDEAHQLTGEASNALLKTLEEPPERVVFILATTQAEDLSETIKSRAQLFQFRVLAFQEIVGAIERIAQKEDLKIEPAAIAVLARAAEGSVRDGLSLLEQAIAYGGDSITDAKVRELLGVVAESVLDDLVGAISSQSAERALSLVHRLIADGQNLQHFCREAIRHFRNLLIARVCGPESDLVAAPPSERPRIAEQAALFGEEDLTRFFNLLMATDSELRRAPDQRLHLELGLLKLINAQRLAPIEELLAQLNDEPRGTKGSSTPSGPAAPRSGGTFSGSSTPPARPASASASAAPAFSAPASFAPTSSAPSSSTPSSSTPSSSTQSPSASATAVAASAAGTAARLAPQASPFASAAPVAEPAPAARPSPAREEASSEHSGSIAAFASPAPALRVAEAAPEISASGLGSEQVNAIRAALQSQKFLWSMVEQAMRWELEGGELRIIFPEESRSLAQMLQSRDPMERLRTVLHQVLGQPVRVCVRLEPGRAAATNHSSELRARFEQDPIVRAMLERFGGQISKVKRPGEE